MENHQEALANLCSEALSGRPIADIAAEAVKTIDRVLEVRGAGIWLVEKHGSVTLAAIHGDPPIPEDVARSRIETSQSSIRDRSALFVIAGAERAAGLLAVCSHHHLLADEVHFLSAVANVLSQAIARVASVDQRVAEIAHEFNNVLMGISPFVELLKRGDVALERRLRALDQISRSIQRGQRLTEEILRR
ncbi:MAG TPA: histidine kinase dimerization/phospho-acceptor domain-containing protein [Thermoanaerobaculia bacterium]